MLILLKCRFSVVALNTSFKNVTQTTFFFGVLEKPLGVDCSPEACFFLVKHLKKFRKGNESIFSKKVTVDLPTTSTAP